MFTVGIVDISLFFTKKLFVKYFKPVLTAVIIIAALILGKIFFFPSPNSKKENKPSGPPPATSVVGYVVQYQSLDNEIYATGSLIANEIIELTPEVAGKLSYLNISEGQFVQKGQLLAKIQDADLKAQLKKIQVQLTVAKSKEERAKKLLDINGLSVEEYEDAFNSHNILKAEIDYLQTLIDRTEIRAPFSGKLGFKLMSEGAYVNTSSVLSTLQQVNPIKLEFSIPEKYVAQVKLGSTVNFNIDGFDQKFQAKVYAFEPSIDIASRSMVLRAKAENASNLLKPGAFARIQLSLGKDDQAIMVPTQAIIPILKGQQVYVSQQGEAVAIPVVIGFRGDKKVQILQGVNVGDTVITTGLMSLKPGAKVQIKSIID